MGLPHSTKTDRDHLIKDTLGRYCPKTFETAKGENKGGAAGNQTQGLWFKALPLYRAKQRVQ